MFPRILLHCNVWRTVSALTHLTCEGIDRYRITVGLGDGIETFLSREGLDILYTVSEKNLWLLNHEKNILIFKLSLWSWICLWVFFFFTWFALQGHCRKSHKTTMLEITNLFGNFCFNPEMAKYLVSEKLVVKTTGGVMKRWLFTSYRRAHCFIGFMAWRWRTTNPGDQTQIINKLKTWQNQEIQGELKNK